MFKKIIAVVLIMGTVGTIVLLNKPEEIEVAKRVEPAKVEGVEIKPERIQEEVAEESPGVDNVIAEATPLVEADVVETAERPVTAEEMFRIIQTLLSERMPSLVMTEFGQYISYSTMHRAINNAYQENPHLFTQSYVREFVIGCIDSLGIDGRKSTLDEPFLRCPS